MRIREHITEILTDACLLVFPLDILYLYYAGAWCEPVAFILYTELVVLYCLPVLAVWRIVCYLRKCSTNFAKS